MPDGWSKGEPILFPDQKFSPQLHDYGSVKIIVETDYIPVNHVDFKEQNAQGALFEPQYTYGEHLYDSVEALEKAVNDDIDNYVIVSDDTSPDTRAAYRPAFSHRGRKCEFHRCQLLKTVYSGSLFDFAITKKPSFLYAPDREHYEKVERGFYMDFASLLLSKAYTSDELVDNILNFDEIEYSAKLINFLMI